MARLCLAVAFAVASFGWTVATANVCNCQYTIPSDWEPNCRVLGQANDKLVAFERASKECINQLAIEETDQLTYSHDEMWNMCKFPNGTNTNVQLVMNELQFSVVKSTAVRTIRELMPDFFELTVTGVFDLKDTIFDVRTSPIDCATSPRLCWAAIKEYVTVRDPLRALVCTEFHKEHQADNANLQWKARLQLCEGTTNDACEPLQSTISNLKNDAGTTNCSALVAMPNSNLADQVLQCDFENPLPPPSSGSALTSMLTALTLLALMAVHVL